MASGSRAGPQIIWKAEEHGFIKETDLKGKRVFPELCRPRGAPTDSESDGAFHLAQVSTEHGEIQNHLRW